MAFAMVIEAAASRSLRTSKSPSVIPGKITGSAEIKTTSTSEVCSRWRAELMAGEGRLLLPSFALPDNKHTSCGAYLNLSAHLF